MRNTKLLLNAIKDNNLNEVKKAVEMEKTDINADLTQGKLGSLSYYTPTVFKAVWSDSQDNLGYRALHWAARYGRLEILNYLCSRGADVNATNYIGNTPLHVALYFQQSLIVKALVEHHANLNVFNSGSSILGIKEQFTPLHYAILYGSSDDVRLLLENVALVGVKGTCGLQPLHLAMRQPDIDKISMLINYTANINAVDSEGKTPLHHAVLDKVIYPRAIELLMRPELNLDIEDDQGNTVVDLLLENIQNKPTKEQLEVLELLLHAGADYERLLYKIENLTIPKLLNYFNQYLLTKTKQLNQANKEKTLLKSTNIPKDIQNNSEDKCSDQKIERNHHQPQLVQEESNKIEPEAINQSKATLSLIELANRTVVEDINKEKLELGILQSQKDISNQQRPIPLPPPPPPAKGAKPKAKLALQSNRQVGASKPIPKPKSVQESMMDHLKNHPKFKAVHMANSVENTFDPDIKTNLKNTDIQHSTQNKYPDHKIEMLHHQPKLGQQGLKKIELEAINQSKAALPLIGLANRTIIEEINKEKIELGIPQSLKK